MCKGYNNQNKLSVSFRKVTEETLGSIISLSVSTEQTKFVVPNAYSIAQAHYSEHAWFRAIYAGSQPVGFVMLYDNEDIPEYFLWRFMIDFRYQHQGFGKQAFELLIEYVKSRNQASEILTSTVLHDHGPIGFYEKLGFKLTGKFEGDESVLCYTIH